jgi:hypothetical protein
MESMKRRLFWLLSAALLIYSLGARGQGEFSGKVFQQNYKDPIRDIYLAKGSGDLLVHGDQWIEYYDNTGKLLWKKTGVGYICGAGVSRDGNTVLFQTSATPKTQQTLLDLTVHIFDHSGKELLSQPNPYRYYTSILSPKGGYLVFGDQMAKKIYVYDQGLNSLWERDTWLWYISFDADDQFIFDSTLGLVLNNQGRRVWELPSGTRPLAISKNADILVSQKFLSAKNRNQIFMTERSTAKQVVLEGYYATVSFDGSLAAFEGMDRKIRVVRTAELMDKGSANPKDLSALWTGEIYQVTLLQLSTDNSKLAYGGLTSQQNVRVMGVDLAKSKNIFAKEWINSPPEYISVTEDCGFMVAKKSNMFEYFRMK